MGGGNSIELIYFCKQTRLNKTEYHSKSYHSGNIDYNQTTLYNYDYSTHHHRNAPNAYRKHTNSFGTKQQ